MIISFLRSIIRGGEQPLPICSEPTHCASILNIAGEHEFNQVFLTDVRVPKAPRLGEEYNGSSVARHLLLFEHGAGIVRSAAELQRVGWVREIAGMEPGGTPNIHRNNFAKHLLGL